MVVCGADSRFWSRGRGGGETYIDWGSVVVAGPATADFEHGIRGHVVVLSLQKKENVCRVKRTFPVSLRVRWRQLETETVLSRA